mgnify:FL=1
MINTHLENERMFSTFPQPRARYGPHVEIFRRKAEGSGKNSRGEVQDFEPFALDGADVGEGRDIDGWIGIEAGVRAKEVVVSNEQGGEGDGSIESFKTAASACMELVGAIEPLYDLFQRAVLFGFRVIIREADDREALDGFIGMLGVKGENGGIVGRVAIGDKID